jgi:hypothetical protein
MFVVTFSYGETKNIQYHSEPDLSSSCFSSSTGSPSDFIFSRYLLSTPYLVLAKLLQKSLNLPCLWHRLARPLILPVVTLAWQWWQFIKVTVLHYIVITKVVYSQTNNCSYCCSVNEQHPSVWNWHNIHTKFPESGLASSEVEHNRQHVDNINLLYLRRQVG